MCLNRRKAAAYRELSQRLERHQKLSSIATKMSLEKEVMRPGRKRKLAEAQAADGSSVPVYKWKRERKR